MGELIDLTTPQARVATWFMQHKGYPQIEPFHIEKLDDQACWYFYYRLKEGNLELEVAWSGLEWQTLVTTFTRDSA